ncbi:hypothetical protein V8C86DRAFT_3137545 [Haematococcus lacustris]
MEDMLHAMVRDATSTSLLVMGQPGVGKTLAVERAVAAVCAHHNQPGERALGVVRLNGGLHCEERSAFQEIARQLCGEFNQLFSSKASYDENLAFLRAMLASLHTHMKSVVFLLDGFEAFARARGKQQLLYNLFDVLQHSKVQAAVIGITCAQDVMEGMEKRVKSRFSHRKIVITCPAHFEVPAIQQGSQSGPVNSTAAALPAPRPAAGGPVASSTTIAVSFQDTPLGLLCDALSLPDPLQLQGVQLQAASRPITRCDTMATQNGDLPVLKHRRSMSIGSGLAALHFLNEGASVEIAVNASSTARSECDLPMPGERDMSCTCAGRGKPCDGKPCLDLEGHVLPQTVHELHRMVRVLQRQQQQQADQAAKKLRQVEFDSSQQLQSWIEALRTADRQLEKLQRQVKQLQTEKEELAVKVAAVEGQLEKAQPPPSVDNPSVDNDACDASSICSEDVPQLGLAAATSIGSSIDQTAVPQGTGELVEPSPLLAAAVEQLTGAVEQLAEVLVKGANRRYPLVQRLLLSAKTGAAGCNLVSSWDKEACQAALHSHILRLAVTSSQQPLPWPQTPLDASLACSPEAGRTNLQAAMRQLQQAKSSTLFLVAQQQAPSHPAAREVAGFVTSVKEHMLQRLEQQLGLDKDPQAGEVWRPQLLAVANAAAGVQLLVSGLQGSCPGLQLVSSLEDWAAPEGQRACEAPVRQLLGKVQSSRPLFLVRPGLVCPAAGGGRQVLVRQQLVALVPDPAKPGSATPNSPFLNNATDSRVKELAKQLQLAELEQRGGAAALHKAEAGRLQPVRLSPRQAKRQAEYPHSLPALSPPSSPLHGYRQRQDGPGSGGVHAFQVDRLAAAHPPSPVPGWLAASTLHQSPAPPSTPTHVHAAPLTSVNTPSSLVEPKQPLTLKKGAGSGAKAAVAQAPAAAAKSVGRLSPVTAAPWPLLSEVRSRVNLVFNSDPESPQASPVSSVASLAAQFDSCSSAKKLNWSASMTDTEPLPGGQGVSESD